MKPCLPALARALAALVRVPLGLRGRGGSILTAPVLTSVLGMAPRHAASLSTTA